MRNDCNQPRPTIKRHMTAVSTRVSGNPNNNARPGNRQTEAHSRKPTFIPSVNRTAISANSAIPETVGSPGRISIQPKTPPHKNPAKRNSTAVDNTVRFAMSESSTETRSTTPKIRTRIMSSSHLVCASLQ
jgi:hypothetical protein